MDVARYVTIRFRSTESLYCIGYVCINIVYTLYINSNNGQRQHYYNLFFARLGCNGLIKMKMIVQSSSIHFYYAYKYEIQCSQKSIWYIV